MKFYLASLTFLYILQAHAQFSVHLDSENIAVKEGEIKQVRINIASSKNAKNEKYSVSLNACYPWISLSKIDKSNFALTFNPSYTSIIDNSSYTFEINFEVTGSNGQNVEKSFLATIVNVDQLPELEVVTSHKGKEFSFEINSYDPNGELSPDIEIVNAPSQTGDLQLTDLDIMDDPYYPSTRKLFTWVNIPNELKGTVQYLSFRSCTKNQLCTLSQVELSIDL